MRAEYIFHWIWNTMETSFVKWASGCPNLWFLFLYVSSESCGHNNIWRVVQQEHCLLWKYYNIPYEKISDIPSRSLLHCIKWIAPLITSIQHDDVIKWKHFPRYWPFVREFIGHLWIPRALTFSLICAWINGWVNNRKDGDLRRHAAHNDVTVMTNNGAFGVVLIANDGGPRLYFFFHCS